MKSEALRGFWKRVGLKIWRTFSVGKSTKATAFREPFSGNLDWKWDKPPYKRFRYNKEHATILENSAEADTIHKIEGTLIANMCETSQMRKPSFMHFPFPHIAKSGIDPSKSTSQLFGRTESWKWISHHFEQPQDGIEAYFAMFAYIFWWVYCWRFRYVTFAMFREGFRRMNSRYIVASCECLFMSSYDMTMLKLKVGGCWICAEDRDRAESSCISVFEMHNLLASFPKAPGHLHSFLTRESPVLPLQEPWTQWSRGKNHKRIAVGVSLALLFHPFPHFPALGNNPISLHRSVCILIIATWRIFMPWF